MTTKSQIVRPGLLLFAATFSVTGAFAVTTWTGTYTNITSVQILESTHGINSPMLTVDVVDSDGWGLDPWADYSVSVDGSSYAVTVSFNLHLLGHN